MPDSGFDGWKGGLPFSGAHRAVLVQHSGPSSYVQVVYHAGSFPTGGDTIRPHDIGLNRIESVVVLGDSSGRWSGIVFQPTVAENGTGGANRVVTLMWTVAATSAEVGAGVDLSAAMLEILVIGY